MNTTPDAEPSLAVIVPVLGDEAALADLLTLLAGEAGIAERIVVDGGGSEDCGALCRAHGASRVPCRPGRGAQQRAGAGAARADVLWFLHADAAPPPGAAQMILAAVAEGVAGGYFRFRFGGPPRWYKSALAGCINLRTRIGVPYGDQGLFFTREAYERAGGFADVPLFEEAALVRACRRAGEFRELPASITVSPRRWERDGYFRRTVQNRVLALSYAAGVPAERLARYYRAWQTRDQGQP